MFRHPLKTALIIKSRMWVSQEAGAISVPRLDCVRYDSVMVILKFTRPTGVSYYAGWDDVLGDWDIDAPRELAKPVDRATADAMLRLFTEQGPTFSHDQCEMISLAN